MGADPAYWLQPDPNVVFVDEIRCVPDGGQPSGQRPASANRRATSSQLITFQNAVM